jgi:O-antigen ligase
MRQETLNPNNMSLSGEWRLFHISDFSRILLFSVSLILCAALHKLNVPFFFILYGLFFVLISFISIRISFFFLLFSTFLNGLQWDIYKNVTIRPDQIIIIFFIITFMFSYFRLRMKYFKTPLDKPIFLFLLLNLFSSAFLSQIPAITLRKFSLLALYTLFYFLTVNIILNFAKERKQTDQILKIFLLIALSPMIYGLLSFLFFYLTNYHLGGTETITAQILLPTLSQDISTFRIFSTMHEPNIFGSISSTFGLIFIGFLISDIKFNSTEIFYFLLCSVIAILSILLSFTRSAWLSFGVGLLIFFLFKNYLNVKTKKIAKYSFFFLALFSIILILIFAIKTDFLVSYSEKMTKIVDHKTGTGAARLYLWQIVIRDVPSSWFLGHGTQGHLALFNNDETIGLANFPLDILHSSGILGLAVFFWIQIKILLLAIRGIKTAENPFLKQVLRIFLVSFLAMWINNFFICVYWLSFPWIFTAFIVGFSLIALKKEEWKPT